MYKPHLEEHLVHLQAQRLPGPHLIGDFAEPPLHHRLRARVVGRGLCCFLLFAFVLLELYDWGGGCLIVLLFSCHGGGVWEARVV